MCRKVAVYVNYIDVKIVRIGLLLTFCPKIFVDVSKTFCPNNLCRRKTTRRNFVIKGLLTIIFYFVQIKLYYNRLNFNTNITISILVLHVHEKIKFLLITCNMQTMGKICWKFYEDRTRNNVGMNDFTSAFFLSWQSCHNYNVVIFGAGDVVLWLLFGDVINVKNLSSASKRLTRRIAFNDAVAQARTYETSQR